MSIRPTAARALREAAKRLLQGEPLRTNGKLTWVNVYMEAGIPRATAARASDIIAEWQSALWLRSETNAPRVPAEESQALKAQMEKKASQAAATHDALRDTIRTLANHVQALSLALEAKETQIASLQSEVASVQAQLAAGRGANVALIRKGKASDG